MKSSVKNAKKNVLDNLIDKDLVNRLAMETENEYLNINIKRLVKRCEYLEYMYEETENMRRQIANSKTYKFSLILYRILFWWRKK